MENWKYELKCFGLMILIGSIFSIAGVWSHSIIVWKQIATFILDIIGMIILNSIVRKALK